MTAVLPSLADDVRDAISRAAEALSGADRVAIGTHLNPDGDALGSAIALGLALRQRGAEAWIGWGNEIWMIPGQYTFLPGLDLVTTPAAFERADVVAAVDCASVERLGVIRDRMEAGRVFVNVDHHVSNTRFGTLDVIDPDAPSTTEMLLHLLVEMGAEITTDIATCLYTGLFTDTGQFSYASSTSRAHAAAAFLIDRGVKVERISQAVFESLPYGYLKVLGRTLERCRLLDDPPLVVSYLTQTDLDSLGVSLDDTEEVINILRTTGDADVAAILKELPNGEWKGSLRSKGDTDVGTIAQRLGGGGHRLAAGFSSTDDVETTIARIHAFVREARNGNG